MKILAFMLIALVASMVVGLPAFADSKLDSLVNIATKTRTQVKFNLDSAQNATDEIRALFERGSQQTDLLISAVEQNEVADAKKYFVAAMNIFKEVTVKLSEPQQEVTTSPDTPQVTASQINYKNDIDRTEKYVGMLKDLAEKNNFSVDFSRVDGLIQDARSSLEQNDMPALERIYSQLRSALDDIQNAIQQQTEQRQNDRARSFANSYIAKIDAMLEQADEMGLSDEEIATLVKAKEELTSISDPNLLVIKIQQYSVTISKTTHDAKQRILAEVSQLENKLASLEDYRDDNIESKFGEARRILAQLKGETSADDTKKLLSQLDSTIKEIENYIRTEQEKRQAEQSNQDEVEPQIQEQRQDTTQQREDTKRASAEVLRLEARLAEIKPYVDENIESKFESAQTLLNRLISQEAASVAEYNRMIRILDFLIDTMEEYVESLKEAENNSESEDRVNQQVRSDENRSDQNDSDENRSDENRERQENRSAENQNRNSDRN